MRPTDYHVYGKEALGDKAKEYRLKGWKAETRQCSCEWVWWAPNRKNAARICGIDGKTEDDFRLSDTIWTLLLHLHLFFWELPERDLNNKPPSNIQLQSSLLRLKLRLLILPAYFSKTDFDLPQSKLKLPKDWMMFGCHWTELQIHEYGIQAEIMYE